MKMRETSAMTTSKDPHRPLQKHQRARSKLNPWTQALQCLGICQKRRESKSSSSMSAGCSHISCSGSYASSLILKLLDVQSFSTFAVRRVRTNLRYGSGEHQDRLVLGKSPVTVILVGQILHLYFETTKLAANINIVPSMHCKLPRTTWASGLWWTRLKRLEPTL